MKHWSLILFLKKSIILLYGLLGLLDNSAALALAYNRVKTRVTPQIEAQVDAILNQWFGSERPQIDESSEHPQIPSANNDFGGNYWDPQPATIPVAPEATINPSRPNTPLGGFSDDEDVVID